MKCITRSKGRNVLIGVIVLVISVSACIGLSIRQAAQNAKEDTLEGLSITATISFDRRSMMSQMGGRGEGGQPPSGGFDREQFSEMMGSASELSLEDYQKYAKASSVKDFYYTLTASLNATDSFSAVTSEAESETQSGFGGNAQSGMGGRGGKGRFDAMSGDFQVVGYSSDTAMTDFLNGNASISEGEMFDEGTTEYNCIISEELAAFNSTAVGDSVILANPNDTEQTYTLKVTGIYSDTASNASSFAVMGAVDPANKIYMSHAALSLIAENSAEDAEVLTDENTGREYSTAISTTLSGTYVFESADDYYLFEEQVRQLGLDDTYTVSSSDITSYETSLTPLNTLSGMAGWFLAVILIIGAVILTVLNIFNVRERKYEIGVLTAMGMKKGKVALQFLTEIFIVTIAAVLIGIIAGAVSAVPVTNALLENQVNAKQTQSANIEQNFGRAPNFPDGEMGEAPEMPDGGIGSFKDIFMGGVENYVTEVNSAMNLTVVFQMLGIAVLLTLASGASAMLFIMRYEPLKILANRD